ncbi:hypothetical protein GF327_01040 [Candidatus Woesearchaeota archaeon]|nr:hypothetical protein [Candidatus Woesearchaeota archaeon]
MRFERFSIFGFLIPILSSLIGLVGAVLIILILKLINIFIESAIIADISGLIYSNLLLLFFISLLTSYANYFLKFRFTLGVISPLISSAAGVLIIYFILKIFTVINKHINLEIITVISSFFSENILTILVLLLILSYLGFVIETAKELKAK